MSTGFVFKIDEFCWITTHDSYTLPVRSKVLTKSSGRMGRAICGVGDGGLLVKTGTADSANVVEFRYKTKMNVKSPPARGGLFQTPASKPRPPGRAAILKLFFCNVDTWISHLFVTFDYVTSGDGVWFLSVHGILPNTATREPVIRFGVPEVPSQFGTYSNRNTSDQVSLMNQKYYTITSPYKCIFLLIPIPNDGETI